MQSPSLTEAFVNIHKDFIGFFYNKLHCIETAKDLSQEVYIKLRKIAPQKQIENPRSYIFTTARNLLNDHLRNENRSSNLLKENNQILWMEHSPSAETTLAAKDELAILKNTLTEIPLKSRQIFHAHRFQKKTRKQIAEEFDISLSGVENHLRKVLNHFSNVLERANETEKKK